MAKKRNQAVDAFRGFAILLVVLGHTIATCTIDYEGTPIFNLIQLLQMPMFFLVSGYVCKYSRPILTGSDFLSYISRRSLSYLLPLAVFTVFGKAILMGDAKGDIFGYLGFIAWNMDSGYWFLFTLWCICMIGGTASFLSRNVAGIGKRVVFVATVVFALGLLLALGMLLGFSFLGIKLTLYYSAFYFAGMWYGTVGKGEGGAFPSSLVCAGAIVLFTAVLSLDVHTMADTGFNIVIRFVCSMLGCIAVFAALRETMNASLVGDVLAVVGKYSLEFYLLHGFFLHMAASDIACFTSQAGLICVIVNYATTLLITGFFICILSADKLSRLILFGRRK